MKKVIALAGKKGTGKTTLALYIKAILLRKLGLIKNDKYTGQFCNINLMQKENDPYNIIYDNDVLNIASYPQIEICSFAFALKEMAINILSLDRNMIYGTQEHKERATEYKWENLNVWTRWINSSNKSINYIKDRPDVDTSYISNENDLWSHCIEYSGIPSNLKSGKMSYREVLQVLGTDVFRQMFDRDVWVNCVISHIKNSPAQYFIIDDMRFESELNAVKSLKDYAIINLNRSTSYNDVHASETGLNNLLNDKSHNIISVYSKTMEEKNSIAYEFLKELYDAEQ